MRAPHEPGTIIAAHYRIVRLLGSGANANTYEAEDLRGSSLVALKELPFASLQDWKGYELFKREAEVLSHLDHPSVPRYYDYFQLETPNEGSAFYIAQELARGQSLASLAESQWRGNERSIQSLAYKLLQILVYLHEQAPPVIHRDIKPHNIIRCDDGRIVLVDFGSVQSAIPQTLGMAKTVAGTYGYMAPEQMYGKAVPASDLYSVGHTLLFLLTRVQPNELKRVKLKAEFRSLINLSPHFTDWLEKMIEPAVEDRFANAREALEVLQGHRRIPKKSNGPSTKRNAAFTTLMPLLIVVAALAWRGRMPSVAHLITRSPDGTEAKLRRSEVIEEAFSTIHGLSTFESAFYGEFGTYFTGLEAIGFHGSTHRLVTGHYILGFNTPSEDNNRIRAIYPNAYTPSGSAFHTPPNELVSAEEFLKEAEKWCPEKVCTANDKGYTLLAVGRIAPGAPLDIWRITASREIEHLVDGTQQ